MQPTFRPNKRKRVQTHGFLKRMMLSANVIKRRRAKGRAKLSVSDEQRKY